MFNAFVAKKAVAGKGGTCLKVGDSISLRLRNDGNGGFVLVVGRVLVGDKYPSRKNPVSVSLELRGKDGKVQEEVLQVMDVDGVHLGKCNKEDVEKMIAGLVSVTVKKIG